MKKLLIILLAVVTLNVLYPGLVSSKPEITANRSVAQTQPEPDELLTFQKTLDEVTVTVTAPQGHLPENAELIVVPQHEGEEEYQRAVEIMNEHVFGENRHFVFDISFRDPLTGEEIEPDGSVSVSMELSSEMLASLGSEISEQDLTVYHITQDGDVSIVADASDFLAGSVALVQETADDRQLRVCFETDSFSPYVVTWRFYVTSRSVTVHYGYFLDDTFREFAAANFNHGEPSISKDNAPNYLIYDVEGYDFSHAYLVSGGERTAIQPLLTSQSNNYQYYDASGTSHNLANGDDIYMVYVRRDDPTTGGSPAVWVPEDVMDNESLHILKESKDNQDGTRTISLTVQGDQKIMEANKLADVILILDVSGSMDKDMAGNPTPAGSNNTRMTYASNAIEWFSNELLSNSMVNNNGQKLCRMSLVVFSDTARFIQDMTDDPTVINQAVDTLSPAGGTNWEDALRLANRVSVDPDRATFVVFVTDGNPTWRMTRYDVSDTQLREDTDMYTSNTTSYYRNYHVFGYGNSDLKGRNYDAAVAEGQSIISQNKYLYGIAISNDVTNLTNFITDSGAPSDNCFSVDTEEELMEAFYEIREKISAWVGFGNVRITDGITSLTSLTAKTPVEGLDSADCFKYYRKTPLDTDFQEWDPASDGAEYASYNPDTGAVEWNLGEDFLVGSTAYKLEFLVWPSQEAFDIITDLNNGDLVYADLPADIRAQIDKPSTFGGLYTLKTNIDPHVDFQHAYQMGGTPYLFEGDYRKDYNDVDPLKMKTMKLRVEKVFADELSEGADRPDTVRLKLQRSPHGEDSWEDVHVIYLGLENNYKDEIEISPGLRTEHGEEAITYNTGYDYRVIEDPMDYHYELHAETIRPILVNFTSEVYEGDDDGNNYLTANNTVKGGLNIKKIVVDEDGNEVAQTGSEYVIKGYILGPDGEPFTFDPAWDDRTDVTTGEGASAVWLEHQNDTGAYHIYAADGTRVGYKMHFASTAEIELHLEAGMYVRFVNLPEGCSYYIYEDTTQMPLSTEFLRVEAENRKVVDGSMTSEGVEQPEIADGKVTGSIYGNTEHNVTVYNRAVTKEVTVEKKWLDAEGNEAIPEDEETMIFFTLINGQEEVWQGFMAGYETAVEDVQEFTYRGFPVRTYEYEPWKVIFEGLPAFDEEGNEITYTVVEDDAPTGYLVEYSGSGAQLIITNTYNLTDIEVEKVWKDDDNAARIRPETLHVGLYIGDELIDEADLSEDNEWKHVFRNYPILDENGQEITYTVRETDVPEGYQVEYSGSGYQLVITNTKVVREVTAEKQWLNADGSSTPPEDAVVTFTLCNGDEEIYSIVVHGYETDIEEVPEFEYGGFTCHASEYLPWKIIFEGLPIYDEDGNEIVYTVRETVLWPGYLPDVEEVGDGGVITNFNNLTDIRVEKVWDDDDNKAKKRPNSVTVALLADGELLIEATLNEGSGWTYVFEGYPILDPEDRHEIEYSIQETEVPEGYHAEYSGDSYQFTVTNTYDEVPDTGERNSLSVWGVLMVEGALCMVLSALFQKKKEEE